MQALEAGPPPVETDYRGGSRADFDRLYSETYARVLRTLIGMLGSRADAEDCTQEAFCRAFRSWPRWRGEVPAEVWVHRIAINTAITQLRKRRVRDALRLHRSRPDERDPASGGELAEVVRALRRIRPHEAAAVVLRHYHGYTNREIAHALGVSERTVGARLAAGLAKLRADPGLR